MLRAARVAALWCCFFFFLLFLVSNMAETKLKCLHYVLPAYRLWYICHPLCISPFFITQEEKHRVSPPTGDKQIFSISQCWRFPQKNKKKTTCQHRSAGAKCLRLFLIPVQSDRMGFQMCRLPQFFLKVWAGASTKWLGGINATREWERQKKAVVFCFSFLGGGDALQGQCVCCICLNVFSVFPLKSCCELTRCSLHGAICGGSGASRKPTFSFPLRHVNCQMFGCVRKLAKIPGSERSDNLFCWFEESIFNGFKCNFM